MIEVKQIINQSDKKIVEDHVKNINYKIEKNKNTEGIPFFDLGLISYNNAYYIQTYIFNQVKTGDIHGSILLLEHKPVITIGSNRRLDNLLVTQESLFEQGIELIQSNRGGDLTFHGPGQLICYPIINLAYYGKDLTLFVWNLEQVIIDILEKFGIKSKRIDKIRGIFVNTGKIASVGIHIKKWITLHGFSLNVNVNLNYFKNIIACGLKEYSQTSMQKILNKEIPMNDVKEQALQNFSKIFKFRLN
jgi:lipoate-protein ligase B